MNQELQGTINYIKQKAGENFHRLDEYLQNHRLFIFLVTKKMVGKSVYCQYLAETFPDKFINISFGEAVRQLQKEAQSDENTSLTKWGPKITEELKDTSVEKLLTLEAVDTIFSSLTSELPAGKSLLFDGLPRTQEQIGLITEKVKHLSKLGFNVIFLFIDLADSILDARILARRVCPQCNFVSSISSPDVNTVEFEPNNKTFHLVCPKCHIRLVGKKGDYLSKDVHMRREREHRVIVKLMEKLSKDRYIFMRTDVETNGFKGGNDRINLICKYSLGEKGEIIIERKPMTNLWNGKEVYALSPKAAMVEIIKALSEKVC